MGKLGKLKEIASGKAMNYVEKEPLGSPAVHSVGGNPNPDFLNHKFPDEDDSVAIDSTYTPEDPSLSDEDFKFLEESEVAEVAKAMANKEAATVTEETKEVEVTKEAAESVEIEDGELEKSVDVVEVNAKEYEKVIASLSELEFLKEAVQQKDEEIAKLESSVETTLKEISNAEDKVKAVRLAEKLQDDVNSLKESLEEKDKLIVELQEENESLKASLDAKEESFEDLKLERDGFRDALEGFNKSLGEAHEKYLEELKDLQDSLFISNEEKEELKSKISSLKDIESKYEEAVKDIEAKDKEIAILKSKVPARGRAAAKVNVTAEIPFNGIEQKVIFKLIDGIDVHAFSDSIIEPEDIEAIKGKLSTWLKSSWS